MAAKRMEKKTTPARRSPTAVGGVSLSGLRDVEVRITLELGRTEITLEEATGLAERSMLVVDKLAEEPVDVRVNGRLFGRGKLVLVGDHYGVQLTELVDQGRAPPPAKRLKGGK